MRYYIKPHTEIVKINVNDDILDPGGQLGTSNVDPSEADAKKDMWMDDDDEKDNYNLWDE